MPANNNAFNPEPDAGSPQRRGTSSSNVFDVSAFEFFSAQLQAVRDALAAQINFQRELVQVRFDASQAAIYKAEISTQEAIKIANVANEKRFEGVNEFRQTLSDQATHFATKEALDNWQRESRTAHDTLNLDVQRAIDTAAKALAESVDRYNIAHTELNNRITNVNSDFGNRVSNIEGKIFAYAGAAGLIATIMAAFFSYIGHITSVTGIR